jgi:hypothetical protein
MRFPCEQASLVTLVTTLSTLLTRLKYSMDLTKLVRETALSLSFITSKAEYMETLDEDIDLAERERDAKRYQHIAANEREFNR